MAELETGPKPAVDAAAVKTAGAKKKKEEKGKEEVEKEEEIEDLFNAIDFFPAEEVEHEVELSFEGQGLKLNTEEDAKGNNKDKHKILALTVYVGGNVGSELSPYCASVSVYRYRYVEF
jgi:hypothetical protein